MVIKVRRSVFETNSSSTHSLTMCTASDYDEWKKGNLVFDYDYERFVPIDALSDEEKKELKSSGSANDRYYTYDGYENVFCCEYESFEETFTTPDGEEIVGFGYYGYS